MEFIKNNFKYLFIFVFSLVGFIITSSSLDPLWNYGFSYAINLGEIPYKDFNMVVTPFYPFLFSIGLLFNNNIIVFYLENALLYTFMFYLLFKLFNKNAWFFLLLTVFPLPAMLIPSYNLLLVFLMILLIYMEKNYYNDYLIGIIIGLMILTKQTVGLFMIIPSIIYYYRYKKKLLKRFIGLFIPCFIFLIYFLLTNSFSNFIDLCFLGLLDYGTSNTVFTWLVIVGIIMFCINLLLFIKHRKDNKYLYILLFSSIMLPLFDFSHILYYCFIFSFMFVEKFCFKRTITCLFFIGFSIFYMYLFGNHFYHGFKKYTFPNKYNNLNYALIFGYYDKTQDELVEYFKTNKDKNIVFLGYNAYFYRIVTDSRIGYFDLLNKGNFGYNGTNKMINRVKKLDKNTIIIVDSFELKKERQIKSNQSDHKIINYVVNNYDKSYEIGNYYVYIIK